MLQNLPKKKKKSAGKKGFSFSLKTAHFLLLTSLVFLGLHYTLANQSISFESQTVQLYRHTPTPILKFMSKQSLHEYVCISVYLYANAYALFCFILKSVKVFYPLKFILFSYFFFSFSPMFFLSPYETTIYLGDMPP